MPQEHHVLKCFSCETFQVHIVKKAKKWECKVCGAKQSMKRNYGRGSAKDCRMHVMKLNEMRLTKNDSSGRNEGEFCEQDSTNYVEEQQVKEVAKGKSKWDEFLEDSTNDSKSDEGDGDEFFETKTKKKRTKKMTEHYPKNKKICVQPSTTEIFPESDKETIPLFSSVDKKSYNIKKSPVKTDNKLQASKYSKYIEEEEGEDKFTQESKFLNIFDSEPIDLDSVLSLD